MNAIAKKPEIAVGCALAAGLVFLNSTYKVPGPVLAREKTGYIPNAIKESDSSKSGLCLLYTSPSPRDRG